MSDEFQVKSGNVMSKYCQVTHMSGHRLFMSSQVKIKSGKSCQIRSMSGKFRSDQAM